MSGSNTLGPLAVALAVALFAVCAGSERPPTDRQPGAEAPAPDAHPVDTVPPTEGVPADTGPLVGDTVLSEQYSAIEEWRRTILRTEDEWRALWAEAYRNRTPAPERPAVDFSRQMVVVAAMGMKPTGGYSISIENVLQDDDGITIEVLETSPGAGCFATQALTAPLVAVAVERSSGEVEFVERQEERSCE